MSEYEGGLCRLPPDAQKLLNEHFLDLDNDEPVEPKVWLTVEEAEFIKASLEELIYHKKLDADEYAYEADTTDEENYVQTIAKRIEQAEKQDE